MLFRAIVFAAASVVLTAGVAQADTQGVPPGVARISVVESGTIVVTRSDKAKTQVEGNVNMPIFAGDYLATTDSSTLAELQLDGYTAVRISGDVQLRLVANDAKTREVDLAQGLVELAVVHADEGVSEIVTPNAVVRASKPGDFRVWVSSDGQTSVTARRGDVDLVMSNGTFTVAGGKTILVRGDADNPSMQSIEKVANDAFDDFNHNRDRALFAALNENTRVPSDIAAYDNLDQYGHWADVAPYGESWVPDQTSNWAPYRDGSWVWGASYGWTWVGNEPWGWLPYHYGSWFYANRFGWCWYPPSLALTPVWVPAFVAFFGYGGGYGYPYYGWVPLAPYETFYPWYPWYWGWYYPWPRWQHTFPGPPPPHRHQPITMHPITTKYRNAAFGGASTFGSHPAHDGIKMSPIRFDPGRFRNVTIRRDPQPVSLPVARPPVETLHRVPLSQHFTNAERTNPVVPSIPSSWHEYYAVPRGGSTVTPSLPHVPWSAVPSHPVAPAPVERAPIERGPSAPIVNGGAPSTGSHGGNGGQGNGGGGQGNGNGNGGGTGGGSRPPS